MFLLYKCETLSMNENNELMINTCMWNGKILKYGPITKQGVWGIGIRLHKTLGLVADIKRRYLG
jgi:hypothetical protein